MKKVLCLILALTLVGINFLFVSAGSDDSIYVVDRNRINESEIMAGKVYSEKANTYYNGYTDPAEFNANPLRGLKPQTYHWIDIPSSSENIKAVTWSTGTPSNWAGIDNVNSNVITIAKDFEENNPGWIVVAGANGDWFRITDTDEADNLMVQNGEVIRPEVRGEDWRQVIGWKKNQELIVGYPTISNHMTTHVYENKETYLNDYLNELSNFNLVGYNCEPSESGVTLYTKDATSSFDLTGYKVLIGRYDLCRYSYGNRKPFVKGEIVDVSTEMGVSKPIAIDGNTLKYEFYLVAKDGSLDNLSIGSYVKCQFDLTGEWKDVESACGYVNQVLDNYEPMYLKATDTYGYYDEKTACKPRLAFGFKEDGSYVAMAIEGRNEMGGSTGLSCFEAGELMRLAGCKTAFNLDGGGSTTLIVRNEYNEFDMVNTPSDGSIRSIGNAILFVMKDPGISWDVASTNRFDATFIQEETLYGNEFTDIKVSIGDNSAEMVDGVAKVTGLEENTEYVAKISYKTKSVKDPSLIIDASHNINIKTKNFKMPSAGFKFININKNSVTLTRGHGSAATWFENIKVKFNEETYNMGTDYEISFDGLIESNKYIAEITYDVVEPDTGRRYQGSETKEVTTLSYSLPQIVKFEIYRETKNRITFSYEYTDEDDVVEYANIIYNGTKTPLTSKKGTIAISDLNLETEEYTFQLQVAYDPGTAYLEQILSDKIIAGKKEEIPVEVKHTVTFDADGGTVENTVLEYVEGIGLENLPVPVKEGFNFLGWFNGNTKVENISKEETTDIVLKAKWEEIIKEPVPGPTTPTPAPTPSEDKGGCGCGKSAAGFIALNVILSCALILFRKRK